MEISILIFWIVGCSIAAKIAKNKGRSPGEFFFIAALLSPILGIVIALVAKPNTQNVEQQRLQSGDVKKCPYCAELVKREAMICKHCGKSVQEIICPHCSARLFRPDGSPAGSLSSCSQCGKQFTLP
jgi:DNA-directed RNA polymerase subunit RPC12/RpoP